MFAQEQVTPKRKVRYNPESNSSEIVIAVLITCKFDEDLMKALSSGQYMTHYKSMGAFGCHGNQSYDPICTKTE